MRSERIYLLAVCHQIGINGRGPHKHNDWLSFELCVDGQSIIIDPGTYCYTGNMKMRRLFRSTAYHNTVVVDGDEQVPIQNIIFGMNKPNGDVQVVHWKTGEDRDILEAKHSGYCRLKTPLTQHRTFHLNKKMHTVEIIDSFNSHGDHTIEWYFHLDTKLRSKKEGNSIIIFRGGKSIMKLML